MRMLALRYGVVLLVLAVGDALWLSYFARAMFRPVLGDILLDNPRWSAAILFYLLYALGVLVFPWRWAGAMAGSAPRSMARCSAFLPI